MLISFPNMSEAGSLTATKLPRLLLIFLEPSKPSRIGREKRPAAAGPLLLKVAPDQDVKKLVRSSELDVSFHHDRVPALHNRILYFVGVDGLLIVDSRLEIFALQHLLQASRGCSDE